MPTIVNEIWIAMADLANQAKNIKLSVRGRDLDSRVVALFDDRRPGVNIHINQHVVAQKRLNTGYNKCFLSEDQKGFRRLFFPGDYIHESRRSRPQTVPKKEDLPERYFYLLNWYFESAGINESTTSFGDDSKKDIVSPQISTKKTIDGRFTFSNFISNFHNSCLNGKSLFFHQPVRPVG
jgi:hypothetical protein